MRAIRADLYGLESGIQQAGAFDYQWKLNGWLKTLRNNDGTFSARYRFDGTMLSKDVTFSACRALLERAGDSGTLEVDVRRYTNPNVSITSITHLFSSTVSSIARRGVTQSTQSIARVTSQISTQSVARWKSQHTVNTIILLGDGLVQYNLSGTVDSDYVAGDTFTAASCTDAANNGTFTVVRVNNDGGNNLVVSNTSGVAQSSSAGTVDLDAWKFTYTNPVSSEFTAGEAATFASHTSGSNDGTFTIYAINQGGNNIIVKRSGCVAQASAAGNCNVNRWVFTLASSAPSYYAVGEKALTSGHTSGGNDGSLTIVAVNSGGSNLVLYNTAGVAQAGVAGSIDTLRWVYTLTSDPTTSSNVQVGDSVWTNDVTSAANRGEFTVKETNVSSGTNVVLYNASGAVQGGSAGTLYTHKVKVSFATDQSSYMTTSSRITLFHTSKNSHTPGNIDGEYDVVQVNRGGGSNYNAVISKYGAVALPGPCGRVVLESKSLFDTRPSVTVSSYAGSWSAKSTNAVLNATQKICPADTLIMAEILQLPTGDCKNLTIQLY